MRSVSCGRLAGLLLFFFLSVQAYSEPLMPRISEGSQEFYYRIRFSGSEQLVVQDDGPDAALTTAQFDATNPGQFWKLEKTDIAGTYQLTSRNGRSFFIDGDVLKASAGESTSFSLEPSKNPLFSDSWELTASAESGDAALSTDLQPGANVGLTAVGENGNFVRFEPEGLPLQVKVSRGKVEHWYNIEITINGNVWIRDVGEDAPIVTDHIDFSNDEFLWKVEEGDRNTYFKLSSKTGRNLYWDRPDKRFKTSSKLKAVEFRFITIKNDYRWEFLRYNSVLSMRPSGLSRVGEELTEDEPNNTYSKMRFAPQPFQVSQGKEEHWYRISDRRDPRHFWCLDSSGGVENMLSTAPLSAENPLASLFKFEKSQDGLGYLVYSAAQPDKPIARKEDHYRADGSAGEPLFIRSTVTEGRYIIQRVADDTQLSGQPGKVWELNNIYNIGNQWEFTPYRISDDFELVRSELRQLFHNSSAGDYFGKYPQKSRDALEEIMEWAGQIDAQQADDSELSAAMDKMKAAMEDYNSSRINDFSSILSTSDQPRWFILSWRDDRQADYFGQVMTPAEGEALTLASNMEQNKQLWRFEDVKGEVMLINKGEESPLLKKEGRTKSGLQHNSFLFDFAADGKSLLLKTDDNSTIALSQCGQYVIPEKNCGNRAIGWTLQESCENHTTGAVVHPRVSTTDNPVYYYVFSASDGSVNSDNESMSAADLRSNALQADEAGKSYLKTYHQEAGDDASLWALVNVDGKLRLKNKASGQYLGETAAESKANFSWNITQIDSALVHPQYKFTESAGGVFSASGDEGALKVTNDAPVAFGRMAWQFVAPRFVKTGSLLDGQNWSHGSVPANDVAVVLEEDAFLEENSVRSELYLRAGKTLTVVPGKTLTVKNQLYLESGAEGTATVTGAVAGQAKLEYFVESYSSKYLSLPFNGQVDMENVAGFGQFEEKTDFWSYREAGVEVKPGAGMGVMVNPSGREVEKMSFTGELFRGDLLIDNLKRDKKGFHFVGNPYPSYICWCDVEKNNIGEVMWLRSYNDGAYTFATWNGLFGVPSFLVSSGLLSPMQGFWVRVEEGKTGSLKFKEDSRCHRDGHIEVMAINEPAIDPARLRLLLSQGSLRDETMIYFSEKNSDEMDSMDAVKILSNSDVPEIYTLLDEEAVAINAMKSIPYNRDVAIGFRTQTAGEFVISLSEYAGFDPDMRLLLIDKELETVTELTEEGYRFSSDAVKSKDRFAIQFVPAEVTGLTGTAADAVEVYSRGNELLVSADDFNNTHVTVYGVNGQLIASQSLSAKLTVAATNLRSGVYLVVVEQPEGKVTRRVLIK